MIPKIIHYCWFGGNPLPPLAIKCIESWKKYLPDYKIKEWNESNFDVNIIPYTAEAYKAKKYAFVSDYARFWVIYKYGGLYFDTDVEVIANMDNIIDNGSFMGYEHDPNPLSGKIGDVAPGLGIGAEAGHNLYRQILDTYSNLHYINGDGSTSNETVVTITTRFLVERGLTATLGVQTLRELTIYPKEYLCPKDYNTGKMYITDKSVAIHHYGASWLPWYAKFEMWFCHTFGFRYNDFLHRNVPKLINILKL